jgi:hypothetical protein
MNKNRIFGWIMQLALLMAFGLAPFGTHARTLYLLDFDGTITDDQSPLSSWRTPWILRRIDRLRSLLQPNPARLELPQTIEISYREYRQLARLLGKGDGQINSLQPITLAPDPLHPEKETEIIPGYYAVDEHISFKYYRPARRRYYSYLVNHLEEAVKRTQILNDDLVGRLGREPLPEEKYKWKGLAFPLVQLALSNPETVTDLVVMTARWHAEWEFQKFLKTLRDLGEIQYVHGSDRGRRRVLPRFHSLAEPESLQFGRHGLGSKKANVVMAEAAQLLNSPANFHEELSADPVEAAKGVRRSTHAMIVGEDDPRFVDSIRKTLEALSGELYYSHKIKFILLNTGSDEDLKQARWPWRWTVFHLGFGREATLDEVAQWTGRSVCAQALIPQ